MSIIKNDIEKERIPLTAIEASIVTEQKLNVQSITYNLNPIVYFEGALSLQRLEAALQALVARHSILTAYYPLENGSFVRKLRKELPKLEKCSCTAESLVAEVEKRNIPYDLSTGPLYRFTLFELAHQSYALLLAFHHAIMDATSFGTVLQDLVALYNGKELAPLEKDYFTHAIWQEEQAAFLAEQSLFFVDMFRDEVPKNAMPCHALRPPVLPVTEKEVSCHLPLEKVADLQKQARELGVTIYGLVMAAASLTTSRYCNSEDVVIGTGLHGRPEQAMATVGMFSQEIPIRTFPRVQMLFTDFIKELGKTIAGARAHQTCSMSAARAQLELTRDPSRKLFFDVSVNYLQAFPSVVMDDGVQMHLNTSAGQALAVDWLFEVARLKDGMGLVLHYSPLLYEDGIAQKALELFKAILERIAAGEKGTLLELARLPEHHEAELFQKYCGARDDSYVSENVITLFKKNVALSPDSLALVAGEERFTYAELDDISDRLACHLMGQGVKRGAAVGILVGRNAFMLIGALGVLKVGAAYVPLDPAYPMARIEFMLSDAEAAFTLVDPHLEEILANYSGTRISTACIYDLPKSKQQFPKVNSQDVVVFLFTSGTTGVPKGVMWSHGGLANLCAWYRDFFALSAEDTLTAYAGFSFDAHLQEFFPALAEGAAIHIITEDMRLNFSVLRDYYNTHNITISFMTTQMARQFATFSGLTTLRKLTMGGEALVPFEPREGLAVYNLYGPTECTCCVSGFHYDQYYDRPPVGKPAYNTDFYVLDDFGRLQPVGAEGELYIAGRQVGLGYKNRPEVTEKAFLANPFFERTGYETMYKTGDAVRWLASGSLEILGRRDSQVKIRGFRVELGEIENRIREFDGVENAMVLPADAPGGGKCAVAYVIAPTDIAIEQLNIFIREKLPEYMVPAVTMQVENIPLTPNGKVDVRKLPPPIFSEKTVLDEGSEASAAPNSRLQKELSVIVTEVLGHSDFSVSTNLLRAGLASLNAIMVMAKVSEKYGLDISVNNFLAMPTVSDLESLLIDALLSRSEITPQESVSLESHTLFPLSENQMGVYYACVKKPESILYNIPFRLDIAFCTQDAETLLREATRLQDAVLRVIEAHPVLKTHFIQKDGKLWQGQNSSPLDVAMLQCAYGELEKISQEFVRPFVLLENSLCRFAIVRTEQSVSLLFDAHHCIFDGISVDVFLQEVHHAFMGESLAQGDSNLFAMAQKEAFAVGSMAWEQSASYIKDLLRDYSGVCELAPDLAHENTVGLLAEHVQAVNKDAVQTFCKEYGITAASLFLAASTYALHRFLALNEGDNVYLATISNGRATANLAKSMGMFVRTLPLALALPEHAQSLEFIEYTQNALRQAIMHEEYPFTRIAQDYGFEPTIMYACELGVVESRTFAGKEMALVSLVPPKPKFSLSIHVEERGGEYVYALQYDDARYSAELMANLAQCMATALSGMIQHPMARLVHVSLMDAEQEAFLRSVGQVPVQGEPELLTVIFEQTAQQYAEKIALKACDQTLTYDALNKQANRLAHALLKRGVRVEDRVAFMLERTSLVPIAMLGIMKAGCAFIPVDPTYPQERIEHVLQDSSASFLLVDKESPWQNTLMVRDLLDAEEKSTNPEPSLSPENLAYLIYTSGSTGKPKGVMLTHAGIANYVLPLAQNVQMHALATYASAVLSITTVAFDMFLKEAFGALMHGITLVFADEEAMRNPVRLTELFVSTQADAFSATPSRMLDFMEYDTLREAILACKVIMCGGEKYPPRLLEYLKASKARLFNSYGPTEITVSCNAKEITNAKITVGAPLYNTREYVVDRHGNNLPVGVAGELLVGGRGLARGYLNLAEETASRFIMHNNERVYRTGDLAAWTQDGEIIILGRNDGQIKLRGLRIELEEIEKALNALPMIKSSVVVVRHMGQEEHLCAYCLADRPLDFAYIREELAKTLTHYMVPTGYMQLETLPKTLNGKLDVKALPQPNIERISTYEAPVGELETALCAIFSEALNTENIGATDNFFAHGGTSLGVTRLLGLAHKHGVRANKEKNGQELSYTNIFASPTPRLLSKILQGESLAQEEEKAASSIDICKDYNYSAIDALLKKNSLQALQSEAPRPFGNALFTGATGFLGITLLHQFLKNEQGKAYCLLRKGKFSSVEKRLTALLYFYFAENFDDLIGTRLIPIEGDVTDATWVSLAEKESVHTVFNCAANVRHFAHDDSIERVNIGGAKRCIELCKKIGARLIHVSTVSVAGFSLNGSPEVNNTLTEQSLYLGQHLENQYIRSKFIAERMILETLLDEGAGLDAKIMRVGNLTGRVSDGEFQINAKSNSFAGRLRALSFLETAPYAMADQPVDLSPVDSVAEAILLLSRTPKACCVFHPVNNHAFFLGDLIDNMIAMGIPVQWSEMDTFTAAFEQAREEMSHMEDMVSLVAYQNMTQGQTVSAISSARHHTIQVLKRLGWQWPLLGEKYQISFLEALKTLGYFDKT